MTAGMVAVPVLVALAFLVWPDHDSGNRHARPSLSPLHDTAPAAGDRDKGDIRNASDIESARDMRNDGDIGDAADAVALLALVLKTGCSMTAALSAVSEVTTGQVQADLKVVLAAYAWGSKPGSEWERVGAHWREASLAWEASTRAGAAPASLLEAAAARMRSRERERIDMRVQRAGVLLVLPLGLCFLPGFLCTTVIPVVRHLATGLLGV